MKRIAIILLGLGLVLWGCIDTKRTNPYDPDYNGPVGSIEGVALLEGGSAVEYSGPTGNTITLNHEGISLTILELPHFTAAETDFDGDYSLSNVPPGTWTLVAEKEGYNNREISNVTVSAGSTTCPSEITLTELVTGKILFSSQFTGTGWNELILMNADGSCREQLTFQDVNMEGGDALEGTDWMVFDISYIDGYFSVNNSGFFLYNQARGDFTPLVLGEEVYYPGVVEGTTSDLNWGPSSEPAITRTLVIANCSANTELGISPQSVSGTSNKGLLFEYEDYIDDDVYIGLLDVVDPGDGTAPRLPAQIMSSTPGPYQISHNSQLVFSIDGDDQTITFKVVGSSGAPSLMLTGAEIVECATATMCVSAGFR